MRRFLLAASVIVLGACGDLQHENPYDPQAPAAGQARTSLAGTVSLEAVGGVAPSLAGITVSVAGQSFTAVTDSTGHYVIAGVPAGTYTIQAVLGDYQTATVTGVTATLDTGGRTVTVPDLALRRVRAQLRGTVSLRLPNSTVETSGGASVSLATGAAAVAMATPGAATAAAVVGSAVTSPSGDFVIPDLPAPVGSYTLTATRLGYVTQTTTVTFQDGAFVVQTVQLQIDPGAIVGTVAVRGAADSFGVTVRARGATLGGTPWEATTTSAADGSFRLSGLPAGTYGVTLERADLVTTSAGTRAVLPGADTALGTLEALPATGALRGVVQLPSAASSAGVVVTATGTGGTASAVTDAAGAYTLTGLAVGPYAVTATRAPEWQPATVSDAATVVREQTTTLATVSLSPWATAGLSGSARLEGATDHSGTTVTLTGADFRGVAVGPTTTPTAANGAWSFGGLRAGSYQVAFSHAGFDTPAPTGLSVVTGQTASAGTLTLAASRGALSGTVTAAGATGHAGTVVEISGGPDGATAVTNDLGAWQVTGLRVATTYTATFRRTGYVTQASTSLHVDAGATTVVGGVSLAVATTGAITGVATVVRPTDAASSAGIAVALTGTDLNGAPVSASATTVSGGAYTIPSLRQGTYAVSFSKDHYDTRQVSGIAVIAGGTATAAAVALPVSTGSIAGQVVLSAGTAAGFVQGTDASGVVVTLTGLEAGVTVASAVTDASGTYRFDGVPVHTSGLAYGVSAQKAGYGTGAGAVVAAAGTTVNVTPSPLTLTVNAGTVTGNVAVNDTGTRAAPSNGTVTVTLTGTAFNATAFAAGAGSVGSAFTLPNVPAGSYELVATSAGRACAAAVPMPVTVSAGQTLGLAQVPPSYTFVCTDAVAPTGVSLGVPQGAGAQPGFTAATSVNVPVIADAIDAHLAGYQYVAGAVPDWTAALTAGWPVNPIPFPPGTLSSDGTWTLWVRAVDLVGNAGPASSVQVVRDATLPPDVVLTTARPFVNDTTTTALISGGADRNFRSYQSCVHRLANATGACPAASPSPPCSMVDGGATVTVSFTAPNTKACVYAQSSDQAGNTSANVQRIEIVSDLTPPTAPVIAPLYDPTILSVHAPYVDFFVTSGATDAPAGGTTPWKNVAWLEVDVGGGYQPLCPFAACRNASNVYNPCSCSCADPRLVCDGTTFKGLRVPLLDGAANVIGVRAVDLAGNVGSGSTQQVPTATSLAALAVSPGSEGNPRGRGRLLGYRYTDHYLRLFDLGANGRPDASDNACDVGALGHWGGVVSRIAVLGPNVVVHADGDATLEVRRPGADGLFCSPAGAPDDTTWTLYTIPGTVWVYNVTGSYNFTRSGEYAAWLEHDQATGNDTIKVQAPNSHGLLAHTFDHFINLGGGIFLPVYVDPPAPVTLYPGGPSEVDDLVEGGDCLLADLRSSPRFRVFCKLGGLNASVAPWGLPASAIAATLSADGTQLAWAEYDAQARATRLHVRSAGADRVFGTGDDSDTTRLGPGGYAGGDSMSIDGGHVVLAEGLYQGSYWLLDWNAGPDALFAGTTTADDTVSRVLPSSVPRSSVSLLTGGQLAYGVSGDNGNLRDVLSLDLSTYRWETVDASGFADLATNGAGTLFFERGGTLTARLPNGTEQQAPFSTSYHAATGTNLLTYDGATVELRRLAGGSWFGTGTPLFSGTSYGLAASGKWGLMLTQEGGMYRYRASDLSAGSPTTTLLPLIVGTPGTNGFGVSNSIVAYQCYASGWNVCVHHPGPGGRFGLDGDDVTGVIYPVGGATPYSAYGIAVGGDKVAFSDGTNMMVIATGPDGVFNTANPSNSADDITYNLGAIGTSTQGNIAVAGNYAAWLRSTSNGIQVMWADLALGITRQLTTHYSNKESLALDASGRLTWIDYAFTTPALFVFAP